MEPVGYTAEMTELSDTPSTEELAWKLVMEVLVVGAMRGMVEAHTKLNERVDSSFERCHSIFSR